jgi:putative aminopeptidase FrvX
MNTEQLNRLKTLLSIPTYTWEEEDLIDYLKEELNKIKGVYYYQDKLGCLYITKGHSTVYPCFVAHLDSVHPKIEMVVKEEYQLNAQNESKLSLKAYEKATGKPTGIGGDDKAGVFTCMEILRELDTCKVFFPVAEETGCHGSKQADADFFINVGYAIQFDSTENNTMSKALMGVPLYEEKSDFFTSVKDIILEHGYDQWMHHPYTDTMMLKKRFEFPCLNFATGYYQYHTTEEYVVIEDVEKAIKLGKRIVAQLGNTKHKFIHQQKDYSHLLF